MPLKVRKTPILERLEGRMPLAASPSSVLASATATVATPSVDVGASVTIPASAPTPGKASTLIALVAQPASGSAIVPEIVSATDPSGRKFVLARVPANATPGLAVVFVNDRLAGPISVVLSGQGGSTGTIDLQARLPGDANGDGKVSIADERAFVASYETFSGDPAYNPAADSNVNDYVGEGDAARLLRNSPAPSPKVPLFVTFHLAPGEQVLHPSASNSGGITFDKVVTVEGHTIPGSIVFFDSGLGDYSFTGPALATDARGNFSVNLTLTSRFTSTEYKVVDPSGRSKIAAFPILREVY